MAERAEIILAARDTTGPAFASATRNFQTLQTNAVGIAGRLAGIGAAITAAVAAFEHFNPKPVIDQADALNKLSQKTGISVETLSAYQYAAKLADVSNEELNVGLKKLSLNVAAAVRGETEQVAAFRAIGISAKFLKDNVNNTDKVFEAIADKFSDYSDGAKKNALANAFFGKSFESLIPLLNSGKEGLTQTRAELEKFGGVISSELAAKAETFNDNLTKLEQSSQKLRIIIAGDLIDALVRISDKFVEAAKDGNLLLGVLAALSEANPAEQAGRDLFTTLFGTPTALEKGTESARHLNKVVENLRAQIAADPGNEGLIKRLAEMQQKADAANAAVEALQKGIPGNTGDFTRTDHDRTRVQPKKDAPPLPAAGAADEAAALLRKQLDGRLKALQAGLDRERDLFQFADSELTELFQHGDLSIEQFYEAKAKAQLDYLAKEQEGFAQEIAAIREHQAKTTKPADRQDDENKITGVIAKQQKVFREAEQAAKAATTQQSRSTEQLTQNLRALDAQLAELSGDKYGAELLRNAQRLDDARKVLAGKTGGDPTRLQALTDQLDLQAKVNKEQDAAGRLAESQQNAEELFMIKAERAGLDRNEIERGLLDLRGKGLASLDAEVLRYGELVQRSAELNKGVADPALLSFYENLKLARERAFDAKDPGLIRFNELARQAGDSIASAFEKAVLEGGNLRDVLRGLAKDLSQILFRDLVTKPLAATITNAIKGFGKDGKAGDPQQAATERATTSLQALADAANAASGALGKPPGTVAPTSPGSAPDGAAMPAATVYAGDTTGEDYGNESRRASQDQAAQSLDKLGQTASTNAATTDAAFSQLAASAIRGAGAIGGLPGALASLMTSLLTSAAGSRVAGSIGNLFTGSGSTGAVTGAFSQTWLGGSGFGSGLAYGNQDLGLFLHSGGIVGTTHDLRPVSPGVFALARRMHDGGAVGGDGGGAEAAPAPVAGLAPNEVPVILMGGPKGQREEVLHANDPRHRDNLGPEHSAAFQRFLVRAFHTGGVVSSEGPAQVAPVAMWFGDAERYHTGGLAGMGPDGMSSAMRRASPSADPTAGAVPAWRDDKQRADSGTQTIVVHVTPQPNQSRDTSLQTGRLIGAGIQQALKRNG